MNKQCLGCGAPLQNVDKNSVGYVNNVDQEYCASCFRLKHYGDLSRVNQSKVDPFETLNKIAVMDALYVWVVDLFHIEESKINSLFRWLKDEPVVVFLTKRELLPQTMSYNKIKAAIMPLIKESHLNVVDVLVTGQFGKMNRDANIYRLNQLKEEFKKENVVVLGNTNVGKSTLINAISQKDSLSVSAIPGTTLELVKVVSEVENLYDSAGIAIVGGVLEKLSPDLVKSFQNKKIKPINFQLKDKQSLIIDGFGYFNFDFKGSYSITCYLPSSISIHRTKHDNAQKQFERLSQQLNQLMDEATVKQSVKLNYPNTDIVLMDLGFITVHNSAVKVNAEFKQSVGILTRKAIL